MKRFTLACLALLLYCSLGRMPVAVLHAAAAFVNSVQAGSAAGGDITTGTINTTAASITLIVAHVADYGPSGVTTGVTDNAGNGAYTACGGQSTNATDGGRSGLFYKANPTTNAAHTFSTTGGAGGFPSIQVLTFSGTTGSPCDSGHVNGATATATTIQPGSVTPSATAVDVSGVVWQSSAAITVSINSSFSTPVQTAYQAGGANVGGAISYKLGVSGAENPTWTFSTLAPPAAARISPFLETGAAATRPACVGCGVF